MKWFRVHPSDLRRAPYSLADDASIGVWLRLTACSASMDGGGVLVGARSYTDRQWLVTAGVDAAAVERAVESGLAAWRGNDLEVYGYDAVAEERATRRSAQNRELSNRRWGNGAGRGAKVIAKGIPECNAKGNAKGNPEKSREEENREENREEERREEWGETEREDAPSSQPQKPEATESAPVHDFTFACDGQPGSWSPSEGQIASWGRAFPGVRVEDEIRHARAWVEARPENRKTARGMPRFLVGWFGRTRRTEAATKRNPTVGYAGVPEQGDFELGEKTL